MAIHTTQAPNNQPQRIKIFIIESKHGVEYKTKEVLYADTLGEANAFIEMYNKDHGPVGSISATNFYTVAVRG